MKSWIQRVWGRPPQHLNFPIVAITEDDWGGKWHLYFQTQASSGIMWFKVPAEVVPPIEGEDK